MTEQVTIPYICAVKLILRSHIHDISGLYVGEYAFLTLNQKFHSFFCRNDFFLMYNEGSFGSMPSDKLVELTKYMALVEDESKLLAKEVKLLQFTLFMKLMRIYLIYRTFQVQSNANRRRFRPAGP